MSDGSDHDWLLPAAIPFENLKGKDLEECVYWLLDAMGAKDLEWRVGGAGGGAADQGRDLEATFYASGPDGELDQQKWWIECKGRERTVEPDAVKAAVNNSMAFQDVKVLLVVTNTHFSNATRDWVKGWQATHPLPKVKLWDRSNLERFLSKNPAVAVRLFARALSPAGKLKALETRFWNRFEFSQVAIIRDLWRDRETITIDPLARIALVANEFAHGDITSRPWAAIAGGEELEITLATAVANIPYLLLRGTSAGIDQRPLIRGIAYLLLASLDKNDATHTAKMLVRISRLDLERPAPREIQEALLMPIVSQLSAELEDVCGSDCSRISSGKRALLTEDAGEIESYWKRLSPAGRSEDDRDQRVLRLERANAPCRVGLTIDENIGCPLFNVEPDIDNLETVFETWKSIVAVRKKMPSDETA